MKRLVAMALCGLVAAGATGWAKDKPVVIAKGTQIGVVNLLDPELMHYHAAKDSHGSFIKIQAVDWNVDDMLNQALQSQASPQGLTLMPLAPGNTLLHARESCFVNASLAKGLPKSCTASLTELAAGAGVSYLIVMAPGLNNSDHAGSNRLEGASETLRGWGLITREMAGAKDRPTLFNEVEMLLINVTPQGAVLSARQWGGMFITQWQTYTVPPDPKVIPPEQLDELQPLFGNLLTRQTKELIDQLHVE